MGAHLDQGTRDKIINHEFVDFSKLLPKPRISVNDQEQKFQLFNKGGEIVFGPMVDRGSAITSYIKWEQAFRVYSDIYTSRYSNKSSELIQYNHVIHNASVTFVWDNVYMYDIQFRMHIS